LDALFTSPLVQKTELIGIAGGEPTIDTFFWQLLKPVPSSRKITITTNGLKSKKLVDFLKRKPDRGRFLVQVSIDGIEEINDKIRGISGGFQKAVSLLAQLQNINVQSIVSFTINRKNYHQIIDVYRLSSEYHAGFSTRMAYCGGAYDNLENRALFDFDDDELETLGKSIVQIINMELEKEDHNPAQLVFWDQIVECYKDNEKQRQIPCKAMETGVVIDLYGEVFPNCPVLMEKNLGNIKHKDIDRILNGIKAVSLKAFIEKFKCGGCWNDCQVVTNIDQSGAFLHNEYNQIKMRKFQGVIKFPDSINFSRDDFVCLLSGWHSLEKTGTFGFRWTEPMFALPVPPDTIAIEMFISVPEFIVRSKNAKITIQINGMDSVSESIKTSKWQKIRIMLPGKVSKTIIGNILINGCFCPGEHGESGDFRKLGMAVNSVHFMKNLCCEEIFDR
jgi:MoaA/NifB/PqqE/SkfB family radical SAM enzyme